MQENYLFEYSIIRFLPSIEREEFKNIGVILMCQKQKFLSLRFEINEPKLKAFSENADLEELKNSMEAIAEVVNGTQKGGLIGKEDIPSRFRWLTAVRSASIQTSRPHCGFSSNLHQTLDTLFEDLVL